MRSARLFALVTALPRSGLVTADELARKLDVSVRTVYRDVRALEEAGVPIRTETGPDGGVGLVPGWRSPLDLLTGDEARALLIGGAGADLGLGTLLATARTKVRSGLPERVRRDLDVVAERFLLDTSGWFDRDESSDHLEADAGALWSSRRIDVRYGRGERAASRRLDPSRSRPQGRPPVPRRGASRPPAHVPLGRLTRLVVLDDVRRGMTDICQLGQPAGSTDPAAHPARPIRPLVQPCS